MQAANSSASAPRGARTRTCFTAASVDGVADAQRQNSISSEVVLNSLKIGRHSELKFADFRDWYGTNKQRQTAPAPLGPQCARFSRGNSATMSMSRPLLVLLAASAAGAAGAGAAGTAGAACAASAAGA
eukprot:12637401-Alexandrium_andersonii.AAC.1